MLRNLVSSSRREHSLGAFESSLLRRIFGRKERKRWEYEENCTMRSFTLNKRLCYIKFLREYKDYKVRKLCLAKEHLQLHSKFHSVKTGAE